MEAATVSAPIARRPRRLGRVIPDERLVERLRAGDEPAFEVIYDRYHADLLAFCRHMLGSREEAEDALQHVFVVAHRHLRADDREVNLRPWLYTVARNRCLSILRSRRTSVALDAIAEPEAAGLAVASEVERRQDLKDLLSDLARLPDEQRAALVMAELGALSHDDIALALDVRRDKVKALVFQARESLIGWRDARSADCQVIREQLATLRGGALRRAPIRRHLETCEGCRKFREDVREQRVALAALMPVVPTIALKHNVLSAALSAGHAGAAAAGAGAVAGTAAAVGGGAAAGSGTVTGATAGGIGGLSSGLLAKGLVVAAVAGSLGGGGYVAVNQTTGHHHSTRSASSHHSTVNNSTPTTPVVVPSPDASVPVRRGPVQHIPGAPVRRGPVAHSHGRGPQTSGNRGRHRALGHKDTGIGSAGTTASGNSHSQGALRRSLHVRRRNGSSSQRQGTANASTQTTSSGTSTRRRGSTSTRRRHRAATEQPTDSADHPANTGTGRSQTQRLPTVAGNSPVTPQGLLKKALGGKR